ncbi:MAG: DUF885 domain-containing protein [Phycisphaerae bacterium]|nr:DUF885 domain-containing protein [Phycisphaerae bacterium]
MLVGVVACVLVIAQAPAPPSPPAQLRDLLRDHERWTNENFPEDALRRGAPTRADRLTDERPESVAERAAAQREFLRRLREIDRTSLDEVDRMNADLFEFFMRDAIDSFERGSWLFPIGPIHGPHQRIPQMAERVPFRSVDDFRDYASRLRAVPALIDSEIATMRLAMSRGMVPPRVTVEMVPAQIGAIVRGRLTGLQDPLARLPAGTDDATIAEITSRVGDAIAAILSALERFATFISDEYLPACRDSISASDLPGGDAYYDGCLRHHTTLPLGSKRIHEIGVAEVIRLRAEMIEVIRRTDWYAADARRAELGPEALFDSFVTYLRTDPRFFHESSEALLAGYRDICKRVDGHLPRLFRTLPRLPYGVREMPRFMAPTQTTAYYQPGSLEGGTAGFFVANTYALDQRPKYEMIPLALHEAMPGHHLQIALAQELPEQPLFRRESGVSAFGEGWALYSERLGIEMGLYDDPYDDFGRLLYEMWRSCRLVVDTGMHSMGWTRDEAIEFMRRNTALSELNIEREVDRYIAWPGQACAYKIGEILIRSLRDKANERLGAAFDLRDFHEVVLGAGSIPLEVLEQRVNRWIDREAERAAKAAPPPASPTQAPGAASPSSPR